jgi:hypothetical protein
MSAFFLNKAYAEETGGIIIKKQPDDGTGIVIFDVSVKNFPKDIISLGFDVKYDPSALRFRDYVRGELVQNFDFFAVTNNEGAGVLRIGGFEAGADIIAKGATGNIAKLSFEVIENANVENTQLDFANLKDDLKPLSEDDTDKTNQSNLDNTDETNENNDDQNNTEDPSIIDEADTLQNLSSNSHKKNNENSLLPIEEEFKVDSTAIASEKVQNDLNNPSNIDSYYNSNENSKITGFKATEEVFQNTSKYKTDRNKNLKKYNPNLLKKQVKQINLQTNNKADSANSISDNLFILDIMSRIEQANALLIENNKLMEKIALDMKEIKKNNYQNKIILFILVLLHGIGVLAFILIKLIKVFKNKKMKISDTNRCISEAKG